MNTEELISAIDEEISGISSKYRYSKKSTTKIVSFLNQWLEEHDAFGWIEYENEHEIMVGTEPLRLK